MLTDDFFIKIFLEVCVFCFLTLQCSFRSVLCVNIAVTSLVLVLKDRMREKVFYCYLVEQHGIIGVCRIYRLSGWDNRLVKWWKAGGNEFHVWQLKTLKGGSLVGREVNRAKNCHSSVLQRLHPKMWGVFITFEFLDSNNSKPRLLLWLRFHFSRLCHCWVCEGLSPGTFTPHTGFM